VHRDGALRAADRAAGKVVHAAAADREGLGQAAGAGAERLDHALIVDSHQAVDIDRIAVHRAGGIAGDGAEIVHRRGGRAAGIHVRAGAEVAGDAGAGVVVDGDRQLAGDAVARAGDRAAGKIVHRAEAYVLEVDAVVVAGAGAGDLAVIVDGGIGAGADAVG